MCLRCAQNSPCPLLLLGQRLLQGQVLVQGATAWRLPLAHCRCARSTRRVGAVSDRDSGTYTHTHTDAMSTESRARSLWRHGGFTVVAAVVTVKPRPSVLPARRTRAALALCARTATWPAEGGVLSARPGSLASGAAVELSALFAFLLRRRRSAAERPEVMGTEAAQCRERGLQINPWVDRSLSSHLFSTVRARARARRRMLTSR